MPTPQQGNFQQVVDGILKAFPLFDSILAKQSVNDNLRMIIARRTWSGLLRYAIASIPSSYQIGTVAVTQGSKAVIGVGTVIPTNDLVNTTLYTATITTGIIDLTPSSMLGINSGMWLLLDAGNAGEEAVFVVSIDSAAATFRANTTLTHSGGITITGSSFAGRQFRLNGQTPFVTVTGASTGTRFLIDVPWPSASLNAQAYEITLVYISLGQDVKELLTMVNQDRQFAFEISTPAALLDSIDPRRNVSAMPWRLAFHSTDPGGSPLYEMWPRPTSQTAYPYIYVRQWAPLVNDYDLLPNGIRSDVLVKLGKAEAARWPGHKALQGGIYFDANLGQTYANEAEKDIQFMKSEDDSTSIMNLVYQYKRWRVGPGGGMSDWYNQDTDSYYV
jgi:hypothetical protein